MFPREGYCNTLYIRKSKKKKKVQENFYWCRDHKSSLRLIDSFKGCRWGSYEWPLDLIFFMENTGDFMSDIYGLWLDIRIVDQAHRWDFESEKMKLDRMESNTIRNNFYGSWIGFIKSNDTWKNFEIFQDHVQRVI